MNRSALNHDSFFSDLLIFRCWLAMDTNGNNVEMKEECKSEPMDQQQTSVGCSKNSNPPAPVHKKPSEALKYHAERQKFTLPKEFYLRYGVVGYM